MTDTQNRPIRHSVLAMLAAPVAHWHHGRYHGRPWHLTVDTLLNLILWGLLALIAGLLIWRPFDSTLSLAWTTTSVTSGQATEWTVAAKNTGHRELKDVGLQVQWPNGWVAEEQTGSTGEIQGEQTWTKSFKIIPVGQPDGQYTVPAKVSWRVWWQKFSTTIVTRGKIDGTLLDLQLTSNATVKAGGQATARIKITNHGNADSQPAQVTLALPADVTMMENSSVINSIWQPPILKPGESTETNVTLQLPDAVNRTWRILAIAEYVVDDQPIKQLSRSVDILSTAVTAEDAINAETNRLPVLVTELLYHSHTGVQFGFGPLPPQVGQETVYRVFWYVRAGSADIKNGLVSAALPDNVRWVGNVSVTGGSGLTYQKTTRQVVWTVGNLEANAAVVIGSFDIGLTPKNSQNNRPATVVGSSVMDYATATKGLKITENALQTTDVDGGKASLGIVKN